MKLKTLPEFKDMEVKTLVDNALRLEIAGVKSCVKRNLENIGEIQESGPDASSPAGSQLENRVHNLEGIIAQLSNVNFERRERGPGRGRGQGQGRGRGRGRRNNRNNDRSCWNCGSQSHLVSQCPTRFCQSCGGRGHDAWQVACPNHS